MQIPAHFPDASSFSEQVVFVLSLMEKGSAGEISMELMELKGISSEEGVADLTIETEQELEKLLHAGIVEIIREKREKKRYAILNK